MGLSKIGDPSEAVVYVGRDRGGIWRDMRAIRDVALLLSLSFCLSVFLYICIYVLATQLNRLIWNRVEIKRVQALGAGGNLTPYLTGSMTSNNPFNLASLSLGYDTPYKYHTYMCKCTSTLSSTLCRMHGLFPKNKSSS